MNESSILSPISNMEFSRVFNVYFVFGAFATASLILVGHWFPWPVRLHRLAAYVYGCTSILIGAGVWLIPSKQLLVWLGFATITAVAGAMTCLSYLIDGNLKADKTQSTLEKVLDERDE
jgi:hypothetical protein